MERKCPGVAPRSTKNVAAPMSSFPNSPRLIKGGLVVLDAATGAVKRTISLQYNPDTLSRSYQVQGAGGDGAPSGRSPSA